MPSGIPPPVLFLIEEGSLLASSNAADEESVPSELWNQGLGLAMPLVLGDLELTPSSGNLVLK